MRNFLVVGAGFSGAVLARELAENMDCKIVVIDERTHVAGNCYTERDKDTGIMEHVYGPHIFHTSNERVWKYINRYGTLRPYNNRVKAHTAKGVYSLPVNLLTINQFFGKSFNPREAEDFIQSIGRKDIEDPQNFEEQALKFLGEELYLNFFKGYTIKQWGTHPSNLPASILKRLPVRFNYDDNYYASTYQGIPQDGYTSIVANILKHQAISVKLNTRFEKSMELDFDHVFYSGPLDGFFNYSLGQLGYRTIYFEKNIFPLQDYQGNPVINYCNEREPHTRIHEHKHFTPWENHDRTLVLVEYSKETSVTDTPFYPKRLVPDKELLMKYREMAENTSNISFIGRLGTYRYLDMHQVIEESLQYAETVIRLSLNHNKIPAFFNKES